MDIREVTDANEKQRITRRILEALPDWFGIPEAREEYIAGSADKRYFAAFDGDRPLGFICLRETGKDTAELYVLGVLKQFHRQGIGRELFKKTAEAAAREGYSFLQVKTVRMGKYDDYDRDMQAKVFLGEYAAKSNTLEAAIAEAAFMTGLERNGDVVEFACYAPLFGSMKNKQWDPDLIYFTNDGLMKTADYYVQQLYSIYRGTEYEETNVECDEKFTVFASTVRDEAGDIIIKLVNASDSQASMNLSIEGTELSDFASDAEVTVLTGASKQTANTFASPDLIAPESGEKLSVSDAISYTAPANSFTVIKIEKN